MYPTFCTAKCYHNLMVKVKSYIRSEGKHKCKIPTDITWPLQLFNPTAVAFTADNVHILVYTVKIHIKL
jgi:hypothetical protein